MNVLDWVDGELLSSVRGKIRTMITDLNKEANYLSATAPASPVGCQTWTDNVNGVVYQRNSTNTTWIPVRRVNGPTTLTLTAAYVATAADFGSHLIFTSGSELTALTLPATSTVADGFWIDVSNSTVYDLMVDGNGTETVDGSVNIRLPPKGGSVRVVRKGSAWYTVGRSMLPRKINGVLGSGYSGSFSSCTTPKNTGSYIDLPPGKWQVTVVVLVTPTLGSSSEAIWGRMFLNLASGCSTNGGNLVGLNKTGGMYYNIAFGQITVINNSGATARQQVYIGQCDYSVDRNWVAIMGSGWGENSIFAIKLQDDV